MKKAMNIGGMILIAAAGAYLALTLKGAVDNMVARAKAVVTNPNEKGTGI